MMLCALIALWALQGRRWFLAGSAASLSFLTWQPAAIYLALALVLPLWQREKDRGNAFFRALTGTFLPLALILIYLAAEDALLPALRQTMVAQLIHVRQSGLGSLRGGSLHLFEIASRGLAGESLYLFLGIVGWAGFTASTMLSLRRNRLKSTGNPNPWPLLISGYWWLIFSLREMQGIPDLIPFLPHLALGMGWVFQKSVSVVQGMGNMGVPRHGVPGFSRVFPLAVMILIIVYGLAGGQLQQPARHSAGLQEQIQNAALFDSFLGPQGQVQAVGDLSLLVLTGRRNLTPLIQLDPNHYNMLLQEPGGPENFFNTIINRKPRGMILDHRNRRWPWSKPLLKFAKGNYVMYLNPTVLGLAAAQPPSIAPPELAEIANPLAVDFGDEIRLLGYTLDPSSLRPGGETIITLYWQGLQGMNNDYTLFLRLVDEQGTLWARRRGPPGGGYFQTSLWMPGEVVEGTYSVTLPSAIPRGKYRFLVSVHLSGSMERVPTSGEDPLQITEEGVIIGEIEIG